MKNIQNLDWQHITNELNIRGFASIEDVLSASECAELVALYDHDEHFRKTISMVRYRFGEGEYKYFCYPLPIKIQALREELYPHLASTANGWMQTLTIDTAYPPSLTELHERCAAHEQTKPTPLMLRYGQGGYNTLHQDLYGEVFFPFQAVVLLNEAGQDYTGGEFVLVEQRPRAQSRAYVLNPKRGDVLIFTTNFRPVQGSRGWYRVNMKHGVSEVHSGQRHTLGIIFHDAQ